ncbi:MAG: hypothetical protein ACQEQV_09315 [Fibrobacterota bacterium]
MHRSAAGLLVLFSLLTADISPQGESLITRGRTAAGPATGGRVLSESPETFLAWSFITVPFSLEKTARTVQDYDRYEEIFRWLSRCTAVSRKRKQPTYFFELGRLMFRFWAIIEEEQNIHRDSSRVIIFHQNREDSLNAAWRKKKEGWVSIENHDFELRWYMDRHGPDSTRLGLVTYAVPTVHVPRWLTNLAMKRAVPACTEDLRRALNTRFGAR